MFKEIDTLEEPAKQIAKMGGYWYINRHFPFIHFMEEYIIIMTDNKIYKWKTG